jgi:hypothetical protein
MKKRIFTQLTLIVTVLALTAMSEEKPLSLENTKWRLEAFVDLETNEIREPNRSVYSLCPDCPRPIEDFPWINTENWFTLEFNSDPRYYSGYLVSEGIKRANVSVDYTYSTIAFEKPAMVDGPLGGVPDEDEYYLALMGAQTFELTDTYLKIYYKWPCHLLWDAPWCDSTKLDCLLFKPWEPLKVQDADRIAHQPQSDQANGVTTAILPPEIILSASDIAAGPNPIAKSAGFVNFYRVGKQVKTASLKIYDASGKTVGKIAISDKSAVQNARSKRRVGSWNLKDAKGRPVSEGTYLVKGTVKTVGGKSEKIALLISVL